MKLNKKGIFITLRQQMIVAKEGYAGTTYGRITPFNGFSSGSNWFEIEQNLPLKEIRFNDAFDTMNLFAIFAKQNSGSGVQVDVEHSIQNRAWGGGAGDYPEINYITLPQCMRFSVAKGTETININDILDDKAKFNKGTALGDDCVSDFSFDKINTVETEIHVKNGFEIWCEGVYDAGGGTGSSNCNNEAPNGIDPYAEVTFVWDNCSGENCNSAPFVNGQWTVGMNFDSTTTGKIWVQTDYSGETVSKQNWVGFLINPDGANTETLSVELRAQQMDAVNPPEPLDSSFKTRITFKEEIDEVSLPPGTFDFGVKKPGFDICRATSEAGCNFQIMNPPGVGVGCSINEDCDDSDSCTQNICNAIVCTYPPNLCDDGSDGCCPAGCTFVGGDLDCPEADECTNNSQCETIYDADPCKTNIICNTGPAPNVCEWNTISACTPGDGCCPASCSAPADTDCDIEWPVGWTFRKKIIIGSSLVEANLTNFPVLISVIDADLISGGGKVQADGDDIMFTSGDGTTPLSHEIETYNNATGALDAWVKTSLYGSANTSIFLYYGNATAGNQQDVTGVWDSSFQMVQHLEEQGTGLRFDSTSKANNASTTGFAGSEATTGKIDGSNQFDGTGKFLTVGDATDLDGMKDLTIEGWVNFTALASNQTILNKQGSYSIEYESCP